MIANTLLNWCLFEDLVIANTFYWTPLEDRWTYRNGDDQRQIDYIVSDSILFSRFSFSSSYEGIGVGSEHRGVRAVLEIPQCKSRKRRAKSSASVKSWRPVDQSAYSSTLDTKLNDLRHQPEWHLQALEDKCHAIEKELKHVAQICQKHAEEEQSRHIQLSQKGVLEIKIR